VDFAGARILKVLCDFLWRWTALRPQRCGELELRSLLEARKVGAGSIAEDLEICV
jgi:hypothetical protein